MPRKTDPTFVPAVSSAASVMPIDQIPLEIREEVEAMYTALKTADGRFSIEFDTEQEVAEYEKLVKSYCKIRPAGEIRYRRSPAKNLPKTTIQFAIRDIPVEKEKATEDIRSAVAKVEEAIAVETPSNEAKTVRAKR